MDQKNNMCHLLRVPPPVLLAHVLATLGPHDLCNLAATCKLLRQYVAQDSIWQYQCEQWMSAQAPSNGLAELTADKLRLGLRLPTFRALFQALHALGSWPAGIWYAASEEALPRGRLLVVQLHPPSGCLRFQQPRPILLDGPVDSHECWELQPRMSLRAAVEEGSAQAILELNTVTGLQCWLQLAPDGQALVLHQGSQAGQRPPATGMRTIASSGPAEHGNLTPLVSSLAQYLGLPRARLQLESKLYRRAAVAPCVVGPGQQEAGQPEPPGLALLCSYQGLWTGSYGPHGLEVLELRASCSQDDVPPLCPISGPRLQGLKLLGDPNVPALRYSFVVDAASCRLGPYDAHQDDPFAPEPGLARPVLAFFEGATAVVSLHSRPVRARFSAVGQINVVPGLWQPEWVPALVLVYSPPLDRLVTLVFLDEGEPFAHAIDLQEFPFAKSFVAADG